MATIRTRCALMSSRPANRPVWRSNACALCRPALVCHFECRSGKMFYFIFSKRQSVWPSAQRPGHTAWRRASHRPAYCRLVRRIWTDFSGQYLYASSSRHCINWFLQRFYTTPVQQAKSKALRTELLENPNVCRSYLSIAFAQAVYITAEFVVNGASRAWLHT